MAITTDAPSKNMFGHRLGPDEAEPEFTMADALKLIERLYNGSCHAMNVNALLRSDFTDALGDAEAVLMQDPTWAPAYENKSLESVIDALPEPRITNYLAKLLNKADVNDREAIYEDLGDLIDLRGKSSFAYETEGMSEVRSILAHKYDVADVHVDIFKRCLSLLEQHGFHLKRD